MAAGDNAYWSDLAAIARKGYVAHNERTAASPAFTTVELVVQSLTFDAIAGQRYKVTADQGCQSTVAGDNPQVRLRWATGPAVTTAGTEFMSKLPSLPIINEGELFTLTGWFTAPITGDITVGVTMIRSLGTGTLTSFASALQVCTLYVEAV